MPKLAVVSLIQDDQPLRTMVDFAIEHGFQVVELMGKFHSAETLSERDLGYLGGVSEANDITFNLHYLHGAMPGSHGTSVWNDTLASFKRNLEMVHRLGGSVIVLHPGKIDVPTLLRPEDGSELIRREAVRNLKRFVRSAAPTAEKLGITICIENLKHDPGYVLSSYEDLASVIDDADSDNVGVVLDVGHCIIGDGLSEAIDVLGSRIRHLHLNDAINGVEHEEIGTGVLDLDEMAPLITGDLNIEFATLEVGKAPDSEGVILRSREVLRERYGAAID